MPKSPQFQTRLPEDRAEVVERYADKQNISKAEAVRRLIYAGLNEVVEEEREEEEEADTEPEKEEETPGHGWVGATATKAKDGANLSLEFTGISGAITVFAFLYKILAGAFETTIASEIFIAGLFVTPAALIASFILYGTALLLHAHQGADWRAELPGRVPL